MFSYPADLTARSRLQLTTLSDLSQWVPDACAMDRRRTHICAKCNIELAQFSLNISPVNIYRILLLERVASADGIQVKYFHRRHPPTTAGLPSKMNSISSTS